MRDFIFIKNREKYFRIMFAHLLFVEAKDKYVRIVTTEGNYFVLGNMTSIKEQLPPDQFCRIHRSYIISIRHVTEFSNESIVMGKREFPLSKQFRKSFFQNAGILNTSRGHHSKLDYPGEQLDEPERKTEDFSE